MALAVEFGVAMLALINAINRFLVKMVRRNKAETGAVVSSAATQPPALPLFDQR